MLIYNHKKKIFYKDIDQMGIVYYSRYFEYFEESRTELLSSIGLNISQLEEIGISLPVIKSHCIYKKGALLEDSIIIRSQISSIPKSRLRIDYLVFKDNKYNIIVEGYTEHAFVNSNGRATRIPTILKKSLIQHIDQ